ncbi:Glycosyltransferase [Quillaja saponaria]|uniref:Glycosyltransferase n=1 Tax=Quillaja saponaria TaxID=32244 RepID=A0AAD7M0M1_QUISA|nr:Glycosyltransferase [Quillaja saponaria]
MRSYGVVSNTFYELKPASADYFSKVVGRKIWCIGPVPLCNRENTGKKSQRGKQSTIDENDCLKWLDSKQPDSVVYKNKEEEKEEWLPEGFEKRNEGRGLVIRGWAPQWLILDHEAVGGFMTHCGWNSILEGVAAGVSMVTWPVAFEQIYIESLVTEVLKIGTNVGVQKYVELMGDSIHREAIKKALIQIMVGDEAEEIRNRVKALARIARQALKEGGSSDSDLNALIEELSVRSLKLK